MRGRLAVTGTVASLVALMAGCSSGSSSSSGAQGGSGPVAAAPSTCSPSGNTTLTVTNFTGSLLGLPLYVADAQGFFKDDGITVSQQGVTGGPQASQLLLAGQADIMLNSADFVMTLNDQGQNVKIISGDTIRGINTVLARTGFGNPAITTYPESIKALKGARVGVPALGSSGDYYFKLMAEDAGLDPEKDFTYIAVGLPSTALAALQQKQIDVWMGYEPGTTIALSQKLAYSVVDFRKGQGPRELVNQSPNVFATTSKLIENKGNAIACFSDAIKKAVSWMKDTANKSALTDIVSKNVKIDPSLVEKMIDDNLDTFGSNVPEQNITNDVAFLKQFKLIKGSPTYDDVVATNLVAK